MAIEEKRRFTRVPFTCEAEVTFNEKTYSATLVDLSLKSALFKVTDNNDIKERDLGLLTLNITADVVVVLNVKVARIQDDFIGVECVSIDVDSLAHLKMIFELNTGDHSLLERNLNEMLR